MHDDIAKIQERADTIIATLDRNPQWRLQLAQTYNLDAQGVDELVGPAAFKAALLEKRDKKVTPDADLFDAITKNLPQSLLDSSANPGWKGLLDNQDAPPVTREIRR
ncbi:MAG: hypothetical protein K2Q01_05705 [Rickettsiales bacterium]|nr:hypothetical protein [Rickettsiales bacterium]